MQAVLRSGWRLRHSGISEIHGSHEPIKEWFVEKAALQKQMVVNGRLGLIALYLVFVSGGGAIAVRLGKRIQPRLSIGHGCCPEGWSF